MKRRVSRARPRTFDIYTEQVNWPDVTSCSCCSHSRLGCSFAEKWSDTLADCRNLSHIIHFILIQPVKIDNRACVFVLDWETARGGSVLRPVWWTTPAGAAGGAVRTRAGMNAHTHTHTHVCTNTGACCINRHKHTHIHKQRGQTRRQSHARLLTLCHQEFGDEDPVQMVRCLDSLFYICSYRGSINNGTTWKPKRARYLRRESQRLKKWY